MTKFGGVVFSDGADFPSNLYGEESYAPHMLQFWILGTGSPALLSEIMRGSRSACRAPFPRIGQVTVIPARTATSYQR